MLPATTDVPPESERTQSIVDNTNDIIIILDANGVITFENAAVERTLGYAPGERVGHSILEYAHADDVAAAAEGFTELLANPDGRTTVTLRFRHKDGTWRHLETSGRNMFHVPAIRGILGVGRDITERLRLQERLEASERLESIGRLAGGVAHDFNNLLTAILGYCELLLVDLSPSDPRRADVVGIQRAGSSAATLTRQLLTFSRKQIIEPTVLDLNAIVADTRALLRRLIGEDVSVVLDISPEPTPVKADRGNLEQVVMNLAVNARDAMPNGGTLTIETANVTVDDIEAQTPLSLQPGPHVRLTMTDTGTGITPEVQARLFEPFYTTKEFGKGTGLGLATVHGIVTRSGGSVSVSSEVARGASFTLHFPRADGADLLVSMPPVSHDEAVERTVLVVEDEDGLRELTRRMLQRLGYRVLVAADAHEARLLFGRHASIDVLLTDVVMPETSGAVLAGQLAAQRPGLKVVYMSGHADEAIVEHGVLHPGLMFLSKPFTSDTLRQKIDEALSR